MRLGIVSDTHGHVPYTLAAVRMLEALEIDELLHCGDIGSPAVVDLFSRWPAHFVFGNVDRETAVLRQAIERHGHTCHGQFGSLEREGIRIAFLHGDDTARLGETCRSGQYGLVCYGHTHVAEHHLEGPTLVVNPGALFRARVHSLAIVELPSREVTRIEV